jgi:malonyl-CoA decarboxylase
VNSSRSAVTVVPRETGAARRKNRLNSADGPAPAPLAALERLRGWWQKVASAVRPASRPPASGPGGLAHAAELRALIADSQAPHGGSLPARAERFAALYRAADGRQRTQILELLTHELAPPREPLEDAIAALQASTGAAERSLAEARLRVALDAPRARFLAQFNRLADGVTFLVELRADLLDSLAAEPGLEVLKVELDTLLQSWFDPGFLELRRMTWHAPAHLLEKLIDYEAVHPIESWNDLRNRLDADRRCYAFFHPRLPDEPLIFVEIALSNGLPDNVQLLLDQAAPREDPLNADTAVFYSISNTQQGLRGISFGELLLKRVIEDLRQTLPRLKTFATLSPLPGFCRWLDHALAGRRLPLAHAELAKLAGALGEEDPYAALSAMLARPDWPADHATAPALRRLLEMLCAHYLLHEKSGPRPLDPVAQFHLNNGARVNHIFWLADTSERGMRQSCGMMVSYGYDLADVASNHEQFVTTGRIPAARRILRLLG